jgi:hypothetical protein
MPHVTELERFLLTAIVVDPGTYRLIKGRAERLLARSRRPDDLARRILGILQRELVAAA